VSQMRGGVLFLGPGGEALRNVDGDAAALKPGGPLDLGGLARALRAAGEEP
jgi:hypothetical protein